MGHFFKKVDTVTILSLLLLTITPSRAFCNHTPRNLQAWHINGQTFLVWEHSEQGPPVGHSYEIYSSPNPIESIDNATLVGRVSSNNSINHRLRGYPLLPEAHWVLPDEFGDSYWMAENEAFFVVTPHQPRSEYYAVVPLFESEIIPGQNSLLDPVIESTDPIMCHIQFQNDDVTIYAHWIDGRADPNSGRSDYPVMGNEYSNGVGFNFAVWEPINGRPPGALPMVIWLHGAGQSFVDETITNLAPYLVPDGLFVTFDDPLPFGFAPLITGITFWWGYAEDFNRFFPWSLPSDTTTIIDYTARRVRWTTKWLRDHEQVDRERISLGGHSMGAVGALLHTQLRPDLYASGIAYVPPLDLKEARGADRFYNIFGTIEQDLKTNLEGQPGIWDLLDQNWRIQQPHPKWPYVLIVSGKNDDIARWDVNRETYADLDSARIGYALYWDQRSHRDWRDAYFQPSLHLMPGYLTHFSKDLSFPAFSNTDLDPETSGRQPDPGNGDPQDGDPWGTWGGYLEWDTETIVDTADRWECTIWITSESPYGCDIPKSDVISASVTPRNLQSFTSGMIENETYDVIYLWKVIDLSNGSTLEEGTVHANEDGSITINNLLFSKDPYRLIITAQQPFNERIER